MFEVHNTIALRQNIGSSVENAGNGIEKVAPIVNRRDSLFSTSTIESELSNYYDFSIDDDEINVYVRHNHFIDLKLDLGVW